MYTSWEVVKEDGWGWCIKNGSHYVSFNMVEKEARHIVKACNLHDELVESLKSMIKGYVNLLELGRDRIVDIGGECDPVDVMESKDTYLRQAKQVLSKAEA